MGPFTTVAFREDLEAVAVRVYGMSEAAGFLRDANRDLLSDGREVSPGMILRTPPRP